MPILNRVVVCKFSKDQPLVSQHESLPIHPSYPCERISDWARSPRKYCSNAAMQQCSGSGTVSSFGQQEGVLPNRRVGTGRHDPAGALRHLAIGKYLREGNKTQLRVPGGHKLVGLRDVVTLDDSGLQVLLESQLAYRLHSRCAIGCQLGVGHGDPLELGRAQNIRFVVNKSGLLAPQHQPTRGLREAATRRVQTLFLQLVGLICIRRKQDLVGRAIADLRIQHARRAK